MGAGPFDLVACDLMMMPESERGNKYVLVMADYFTRYSIATPVVDKTALTVTRAIIRHLILVHGPPRRLLTDNGGEFRNDLLKEVCEQLETKRIFTSPYHPQTDGVVERLNQTILNMVSTYVDANHSNWDELLPYLMYAHNNTATSATGMSPFRALFGRACPSTLELLLEPRVSKIQGRAAHAAWDDIQENLSDMSTWMLEFQKSIKAKESEQSDRRRKPPKSYALGAVVWILSNRAPTAGQKPKLLPRYRGPYVVVGTVGSVALRLRALAGAGPRTTIHIDNVKEMRARGGKRVVLTRWQRPRADVDDSAELDDGSPVKRPFEVEAVTGHAYCDGVFWLRLKWKGYKDQTLEDEFDCDCHSLVESYFDSNSATWVDAPRK